MPKIEVEEAEWNARGQLTNVISNMLKHPTGRAKLLQAQKEVYPDTPIPEIDAAKPVLDEVGKVRKDFEDYKKSREELDAKREQDARLTAFANEWEGAKQRVRDRYPDFNDKAIEEIDKFAQEKGIPDFEAAAARYREMHPPATIAEPSGSGGWGFFEEHQDSMKDNMEKLMQSHGDNEAVTGKMVNDALAEIRGGRRAA